MDKHCLYLCLGIFNKHIWLDYNHETILKAMKYSQKSYVEKDYLFWQFWVIIFIHYVYKLYLQMQITHERNIVHKKKLIHTSLFKCFLYFKVWTKILMHDNVDIWKINTTIWIILIWTIHYFSLKILCENLSGTN
jgi:hypothetical protein